MISMRPTLPLAKLLRSGMFMLAPSLISNASDENARTSGSAPPGTWQLVLISQTDSSSFQSIGTVLLVGKHWSGNGSLYTQRVVFEGVCEFNSASLLLEAAVKVFFCSADDITQACAVAGVS